MNLITERINKSKSVLLVKGIEYAKPHNRFHNFIESLKFFPERISPIEVAYSFAVKQFTSLVDLLNQHPLRRDSKLIEEKIGDSFNYCVLILGMIQMQSDLDEVLSYIQGEISMFYLQQLGIKNSETLVQELISHAIFLLNEKSIEACIDLIIIILLIEQELKHKE